MARPDSLITFSTAGLSTTVHSENWVELILVKWKHHIIVVMLLFASLHFVTNYSEKM